MSQNTISFKYLLEKFAITLLNSDTDINIDFFKKETNYNLEFNKYFTYNGNHTDNIEMEVLIENDFSGADGKTLQRLVNQWSPISVVYLEDSLFEVLIDNVKEDTPKLELSYFWDNALRNRAPLCDEIQRLKIISSGYYFKSICVANGKNEYGNLRNYMEQAEQPLGHACIATSVAYLLGWVSSDRLVEEVMPEVIKKEAFNVFKALMTRLKTIQNPEHGDDVLW